jgi:hypothetical protein
VKTQIAFFGAGGITLLFAFVWVSTLGARLHGINLKSSSEMVTEVGSEESTLFMGSFDSAKEQLGTAIQGIEKFMPDEAPALEPTGPTPYDELDTFTPGTESKESVGGATPTLAPSIEGNGSPSNDAPNEVVVPTQGRVDTTIGTELPQETSSSTSGPQTPRVVLIGTTTSHKTE